MFFQFLYLITLFSCSGIYAFDVVRGISAVQKPEYKDTYEDSNNVGAYTVRSLLKCTDECSVDRRCLSFFYNHMTKSCILHADPFVYTVRTKSGTGWKFYLTVDRSGRCTDEWIYYRHLDLFYQFGPKIPATNKEVAKTCNGSGQELIRISSEERNEYMKMITANIGIVYPHSICIQGTNMIHGSRKWTFKDGTLMTYFNWKTEEPSTLAAYIRVLRYSNYGWAAGPISTDKNCTYICERR